MQFAANVVRGLFASFHCLCCRVLLKAYSDQKGLVEREMKSGISLGVLSFVASSLWQVPKASWLCSCVSNESQPKFLWDGWLRRVLRILSVQQQTWEPLTSETIPTNSVTIYLAKRNIYNKKSRAVAFSREEKAMADPSPSVHFIKSEQSFSSFSTN